MTADEIIQWLLQGDVAIQYQVYRDLLGTHRPDLQRRIAEEGWGKAFLAQRNPNGHWGRGFYQPKWISSHYTLLDLKHIGIAPDVPAIKESIQLILNTSKDRDRQGLWPLPAKHPGQTHFDMETPGKPSRWNTLRALRVLHNYGAAAALINP